MSLRLWGIVLSLGLGCAVGLLPLSAADAASSTLPSQSDVMAVMNKVATYARQHYPAQAQAYWEQGVYHLGLMAWDSVANDDAVLAYTEAFGDYNQWLLDRVGTGNRHNRLAAGQSWLAANQSAPEPLKIADTLKEVAAQTAAPLTTVTASAYFTVDAQFMALPAFAVLGRLYTNTSYFDRMGELFHYNKTTLGLYDSTAHLYYRDASYIYPAKRTPSGQKVFWSRGNGWALGALVGILRNLPTTHPARADYVTTFQQLSAALLAVQRPDGFWNMSLGDPTYYAGPETTGTSLFVYGMAWGIQNGLLSPTSYEPAVARAWNALVATAVHLDGKLGYVQGVGKEPVPTTQVTYNSSANFGVGVFLLAGSEVFKLAGESTTYEVETVPTAVSSGDSQQDVTEPTASGGKYNRGHFNSVNDYIQYSVSLSAPGTYAVKVRFAKDASLGTWQFYTAGHNVGAPQDAYSPTFTWAEVELGQVTYSTAGSKVFRFTITGKNSSSTAYRTAIDYVTLTEQ